MTATLPRRGAYRRRPLAGLRWVVLHHTATSPDVSPEALARMHLARGWAGLGYHYLVYENGRIVKARPVTATPACVRGANAESVCVALVGAYHSRRPSEATVLLAGQLVEDLAETYRLVIVTHRALAATICPGDGAVAAWQDHARRGVIPAVIDHREEEGV